MSIRSFQVTPNQYQEFKFSVDRSAEMRIELNATEEVTLKILDREGLAEYKNSPSFDVAQSFSLPPRRYVRARIPLRPGLWFVIVEGYERATSGTIDVSLDLF